MTQKTIMTKYAIIDTLSSVERGAGRRKYLKYSKLRSHVRIRRLFVCSLLHWHPLELHTLTSWVTWLSAPLKSPSSSELISPSSPSGSSGSSGSSPCRLPWDWNSPWPFWLTPQAAALKATIDKVEPLMLNATLLLWGLWNDFNRICSLLLSQRIPIKGSERKVVGFLNWACWGIQQCQQQL